MIQLSPSIENISKEYVLVQAWKKATAHIRYHNWFADTLELDISTADLPAFLKKIADELRSGSWESDNLRIVPAPKNQQWSVAPDTNLWKPISGNAGVKLRPLAHVSLRDQVAATALMLCLADQVESLQGDPRIPVTNEQTTAPVISYGNRLFCDRAGDGSLHHRWGSTKLYRAFFEDYRSFIARPEIVAESLVNGHERIIILQADLAQFYDRVRPQLLKSKLRKFKRTIEDERFFNLADQVMCWGWHRNDIQTVKDYARSSHLDDFTEVALPQGLVAAGFFANIVLIDFDQHLTGQRGQEIASGIILRDASRYVDDLRLVLTINRDIDPEMIESISNQWLKDLLDLTAEGLRPATEKTKAAFFRGDKRPLLRQSRKMKRIQIAVSGGFDAAGGEDIIDAVQGLVRAQQQYSEGTSTSGIKSFVPVPDVRDETVSRFAAGRFRKTYRSLRPLLRDEDIKAPTSADYLDKEEEIFRGSDLSKSELDDEARTFALGLIDIWISNPSNVRLLRIGLDLWPAADVLKQILLLLRPYTIGAKRGKARRVALYCLSEILRAGATETGFIEDSESFPKGVNIEGYRKELADEARRLLSPTNTSLPWYLKQQALLFLAVTNPASIPIGKRPSRNPETRRYLELIRFLRNDFVADTAAQFAIFSIITRRSILNAADTTQLLSGALDDRKLIQILHRDPSLALELDSNNIFGKSNSESNEGYIKPPHPSNRWPTLAELVLDTKQPNPLRNDIGVLSLAHALVKQLRDRRDLPAITPYDIEVKLIEDSIYGKVDQIQIKPQPKKDDHFQFLYFPPSWCPESERWRFQLGYIIRFIISANIDFTKIESPPSWRENENLYRPTRSHWYQRIYGYYNGHEAFGDTWLPISKSTEDLLFSLLLWPGCKKDDLSSVPDDLLKAEQYLAALLKNAIESIGASTGMLMLKIPAPIFTELTENRPLRACVVQTLTPELKEFIETDLTFSDPAIRRKHRNHLSTALAAVEKMLDLRETHKPQHKRLDWLILPELSVHPKDVQTHLIPFARAHKTIILAGMTYEKVVSGDPLVNSALWIIPRIVSGQGLQIVVRRQGKKYLAPVELEYEQKGLVHGFRPCQWLVGYEWSLAPSADPLWLTAAVCYDATDLKLASDLRLRSDVFAIPALNQDVGTFDQMAIALHYHMYQLVVIANNGQFGGSNAHTPKKEPYLKQVFHTHGQPQASISFFEIDDIQEMKRRHQSGKTLSTQKNPMKGIWKYPPAGT